MEKTKRKNEMGEVKSFKDFMYNTGGGRILIFSTLLTGLVLGCEVTKKHAIYGEPPIKYEQTIGNEKPDVFIERDGVKYFSDIDGKSVEDILKK